MTFPLSSEPEPPPARLAWRLRIARPLASAAIVVVAAILGLAAASAPSPCGAFAPPRTSTTRVPGPRRTTPSARAVRPPTALAGILGEVVVCHHCETTTRSARRNDSKGGGGGRRSAAAATRSVLFGGGTASGRRRRTHLHSFPSGGGGGSAEAAVPTNGGGNNKEATPSSAKNARIGLILKVLTRTLLVVATFLTGFRLGRAPPIGGEGEAGAVLYGVVDAASRRAAAAVPRLRRPTPASLLLSALLARELWRSIPSWLKSRITRRVSRLRGGKKGDGTGGGGADGGAADAEREDPDDMTSYGNLSMKLQGLLRSVEEKLPPEAKETTANIQAPSLALLQLAGQLREQDPGERDKLYDSSGTVGTLHDLDGLRMGFEYADWAYDEDLEGRTLKENLEREGFCLVRHDKTTVPGYVGHYVAIHPGKKLALIGVKGTSTVEDLLTDCCGRAVTHELEGPYCAPPTGGILEMVGGGKGEGEGASEESEISSTGTMSTIRCHEGVLISARRLADDVQPLVEELFLPSGYTMLLTGHSLGAGASALLGIMLKARNPELAADTNGEKLKVWAYASPPVLDFDTAAACKPFITTIVNNADVIPRASLSNLLILLEQLGDVGAKLEEAGIRKSASDGGKIDAVALLRQLSQWDDGKMLMTPRELAESLERAQGKVAVRDPDHLFVPGKVVAMYSRWEEEKAAERAEAEEEEKKKTRRTREKQAKKKGKSKGGSKSADGAEAITKETEEEAVAATTTASDGAVKPPEEYVRISDGNMKILRQISLDDRMITDHMAPAYRRSLKDLATSAT